jgi:hypothetical protein
MDATTQKQQTLQEFLKPSKAQRVWQIILAVLLSLMVLGMAYELSKPQEEPVRMSTQLSGNTYCFVDVSLVSSWLLKVTGDEEYTLYEAMDPDGNWYILNLDDAVFASLSLQQEAYENYTVDSAASFTLPEPVRLTGMTSYLDRDDAKQISAYYDNATADDIITFYGANYFNEGASNRFEDAAVYIVFGALIALFLLIVWLTNWSKNKSYQKSERHLYELGLLDVAEAEFSAPESIRYPKSKLVLSRQFVFCGSSGWMIPYSDIGWTYQRTQRSYGIPVGKQIIAGLVNGKSVVLANRGVNDEVLTEAVRAIFTANPECLIGYSFENIKLYNQRVKEYKQNNPK